MGAGWRLASALVSRCVCAAASLASCVADVDLAGKACDPEHPCVAGYLCTAGSCELAPSAGEGEGEGEGAILVDAPTILIDGGVLAANGGGGGGIVGAAVGAIVDVTNGAVISPALQAVTIP